MNPVCAIYSTFLQRAYDPIMHDVCLQKLPVTFCMDRAGLSPNDGPTHHGLFDISYLRCLPNSVIMSPKDEDELQDMIKTSIASNKPCFIRYPRGSALGVKLKEDPSLLKIGKAEELIKGEELSIWALGNFVETGMALAEKLFLEFGIKASVVNARFAKPLDEDLLHSHAANHDHIITLEDGVLNGGFGSAIVELLSDKGIQVPVSRFGWPDEFIDHGDSVDSLRKKYILDTDSIFKRLVNNLKLELKSVV